MVDFSNVKYNMHTMLYALECMCNNYVRNSGGTAYTVTSNQYTVSINIPILLVEKRGNVIHTQSLEPISSLHRKKILMIQTFLTK